jgi:cytochrome c oxidase cbb3-type subunit II
MMSDTCEMLAVKNRAGELTAHYRNPPVEPDAGTRISGPYIAEIPDAKQRANFLRNGLVMEVAGPPDEQPGQLPAAPPVPRSHRYRMTGRCDALWVTDSDGKQNMHIFDPVIAGATHGANGPVIEWISAEQASTWLMQGFIEKVGDGPAPAALPAQEPVDSIQVVSQDGIDECVRSLDRLGVPADSGAPTCRQALREGGESYSNATIALAVRARKSLSGTE